ncbi:MAG: hypothetical protein ABSD03_14250 [Vulcanimicrobiaceae bacterium]|jgi:hypothetical protein
MIGHARTVGALRDAIANLPDDTPIDFNYWPNRSGSSSLAIYEGAGATFYVSAGRPRKAGCCSRSRTSTGPTARRAGCAGFLLGRPAFGVAPAAPSGLPQPEDPR